MVCMLLVGVTGEVTGRSLAVTGQGHDLRHARSHVDLAHSAPCLCPFVSPSPRLEQCPKRSHSGTYEASNPKASTPCGRCSTDRSCKSGHLRLGSTHCDKKWVRSLRTKTSLRSLAWPHERAGLASPPPQGMQSWGMCQSRMLCTALSGDTESSPALVNIALVGGRGTGVLPPTSRGTFFSQTPELVLMRGNNTKSMRACEYTPSVVAATASSGCLVTV